MVCGLTNPLFHSHHEQSVALCCGACGGCACRCRCARTCGVIPWLATAQPRMLLAGRPAAKRRRRRSSKQPDRMPSMKPAPRRPWSSIWKQRKAAIELQALEEEEEEEEEDDENKRRRNMLYKELEELERERRVRLRSPRDTWRRALEARAKLPTLTWRDVRRHREPLYVVIEGELIEDGFPESAAIVHRLLALNADLLMASKQVKLKWAVCDLRKAESELEALAKGLVAAEVALRSTDPWASAERADGMLKLALRSLELDEPYFWLTEQLLLLAVGAADNFRLDGGWREMRARYVYGFLLSTKIGHMDFAREELDRARELAMGRPWTLDLNPKVVEASYPEAFLSATDLLCRVLLYLSRTTRRGDPLQAARYSSAALRRLGHPALTRLEALTLVELGVCFEVLAEYSRAIAVLSIYLRMPLVSHDAASDCSAYLELSYCYRHLGDVRSARRCLEMVLRCAQTAGHRGSTTVDKHMLGKCMEELLQTATRANKKEMVAVAHRFLGEGLLMLGLYRDASDNLEKAMRLFLPMNKWNDVDRVRVIHSITKGTELMPLMKELVREAAEMTRGIHVRRLLRWRIHHMPFWNLLDDKMPRIPAGDLFRVVTDSAEDEERVKERRRRDAASAARLRRRELGKELGADEGLFEEESEEEVEEEAEDEEAAAIRELMKKRTSAPPPDVDEDEILEGKSFSRMSVRKSRALSRSISRSRSRGRSMMKEVRASRASRASRTSRALSRLSRLSRAPRVSRASRAPQPEQEEHAAPRVKIAEEDTPGEPGEPGTEAVFEEEVQTEEVDADLEADEHAYREANLRILKALEDERKRKAKKWLPMNA